MLSKFGDMRIFESSRPKDFRKVILYFIFLFIEIFSQGLGQLALQLGGDNEEEDDEDVGPGREVTVVGDTWVGDGDSDCESVDSEVEDSLQHAGVYTAEEVVRTLRDKLIRLQKLYIDQFQRLLIKMRESRYGHQAVQSCLTTGRLSCPLVSSFFLRNCVTRFFNFFFLNRKESA